MSARKTLPNEKGQSIVELTLIVPFLLVALYLSVVFCMLFFNAQYAQNAVREGARIGAILPDCSAGSANCVGTAAGEACPGTTPVAKEVCSRLSPLILGGPAVTVNLTGDIGSSCMRQVEVSVTGTYTFGFYNVMALIGLPLNEKTLTINRSAVARYQGQPVTWTGPC
jgi:Flp pilus assembly protein TadG